MLLQNCLTAAATRLVSLRIYLASGLAGDVVVLSADGVVVDQTLSEGAGAEEVGHTAQVDPVQNLGSSTWKKVLSYCTVVEVKALECRIRFETYCTLDNVYGFSCKCINKEIQALIKKFRGEALQ